MAQEDSKNPPDTDYEQPKTTTPPAIPATDFVIPDLPDSWDDKTTYEGPRLSIRMGLKILVDYNAFNQDTDSETQVGIQVNQWNLRTARILLRGEIKFPHSISYLANIDYAGDTQTSSATSRFGFSDLSVATELGRFGRLRYGKMKEPFIYEVVTDAGTTQQLERALEPFFVRRNTGLKFTRLFAGNNMLASAGWYNDWWVEGQKFSESGNDFVARLTGLAQSSHDGADYTHLGIGLRYVGAGEGTLQFKGRPENHVSAFYVDTGSFAGDHALNLDLESVWNRGPLYVTAELARSWVSAPNAGNPRFWGAYGIVSYVLTGEHRPYDKKVGYARRILPAHKWGAWELVARYSHVDLMDQLVDGGIFDRGTIGLNWWATRRWRLSVDYGVVNLDRKGLNGLTRIVHTRLQWTF